MNKTDLIAEIAEAIDSKEAAEAALTSMLTHIEKALKRGEEVRLSKLGTFKVKKRAARKARNPKTGEIVKVPARKVPVFVPHKALKDSIN